MCASGVTRPCVVILSTASVGGLFEGSTLCDLVLISTYVQFSPGVDLYLIDRNTAGIVLVTPFGEDQLGGDIVPATGMRTGWGRGRRKVIA
jgi:hypothetical protein